jgi:hypothetical protein
MKPPPYEKRVFTPSEKRNIIRIQRKIRSNQREELHASRFYRAPVTGWSKLNMFAPYHYSDLHRRLEEIISNDIVRNLKIVNGKQLYHYTSLSNLPSIIQDQAMYGNAYLKSNGTHFIPNVFCCADLLTGDSNVICFCPGQVDTKAFIYDRGLKTNVCRLSIDIIKRNKPPYTKGTYNRFFKLSDLQYAWSASFNINTFKVYIENLAGGGMNIFLSFNDKKKHEVQLTKNEMVYYGNIFQINRFCSVQLFNIINKVNNARFKTNFYNHLSALNDDELRKLLIVFSQNLTLFAEANFNTFLSLDEIKINEILVLGDHKIKLDFSELDDKNYKKALELIATSEESMDASDLSGLKELYGKSIDEDKTICVKKSHPDGFECIHVFGTRIPYYDADWGNQDYTNLPASLFATNEYVEIRVGVNYLPELKNQNSILVLK